MATQDASPLDDAEQLHFSKTKHNRLCVIYRSYYHIRSEKKAYTDRDAVANFDCGWRGKDDPPCNGRIKVNLETRQLIEFFPHRHYGDEARCRKGTRRQDRKLKEVKVGNVVEFESEDESQFSCCQFCKEDGVVRNFTSRSGLGNHLRQMHADRYHPTKTVEFRCQENGCDFAEEHRFSLVEHLRSHHEFPQFVSFHLILPSVEVFELWKEQLAGNGRGIFKHTGRRKNENHDSQFYICDRCARNTRFIARKTKKHGKESAQFSLPFRCTAHFKAVFPSDQSVMVTGCLGHYGHDPEKDVYINKKLADQGPYVTVPLDPSTIYSSSAFPTLQRTQQIEGEGESTVDTYLPLQRQDAEMNTEEPVTWEYIPEPLTSEEQENLSETASILLAVITRIGAERSKRAIHELTRMKQLAETFGRDCSPTVLELKDAVPSAKPIRQLSPEGPRVWISPSVFTPLSSNRSSCLPGLEEDDDFAMHELLISPTGLPDSFPTNLVFPGGRLQNAGKSLSSDSVPDCLPSASPTTASRPKKMYIMKASALAACTKRDSPIQTAALPVFVPRAPAISTVSDNAVNTVAVQVLHAAPDAAVGPDGLHQSSAARIPLHSRLEGNLDVFPGSKRSVPDDNHSPSATGEFPAIAKKIGMEPIGRAHYESPTAASTWTVIQFPKATFSGQMFLPS